jgi:uroporphyrinogen decarboxylase
MAAEPARERAPLTPRDRFLRAARGKPLDRPPVWLMRQAGRYLPEYRAIRARKGFLEMCRDPDLAAEVSLQPYRRFGPDAVIVFSDILLPLAGLGLELEFSPGPLVRNPISTRADLARLEGDVAAAIAPTCEAIRRIRREVGNDVPIIGFAGAPWSLAAYATEERLSRDIVRIRALAFEDAGLLDELLDRLAAVAQECLRLQALAGADALQIFDTWAGVLSPGDYRRLAGRALARMLDGRASDEPPILVFARGAAHLLEEIAGLGPDVVSLDWRTDLAEAAARIGRHVSLQGNLDPAALFAPPETVDRMTRALVEKGRKARGHIANLGHGVYPSTPVEGVAAFVEAVKDCGGSER